MPVRSAEAEWRGDLKRGEGSMAFGGGAFQGAYSFASRFESGNGTNPEELIAAAHAGCFSMALAGELATAGHTPTRLQTTAHVRIDSVDNGFQITHIELITQGDVPGIDAETFRQIAEKAKTGCPVSKALASVPEITLDARLL